MKNDGKITAHEKAYTAHSAESILNYLLVAGPESAPIAIPTQWTTTLQADLEVSIEESNGYVTSFIDFMVNDRPKGTKTPVAFWSLSRTFQDYYEKHGTKNG